MKFMLNSLNSCLMYICLASHTHGHQKSYLLLPFYVWNFFRLLVWFVFFLFSLVVVIVVRFAQDKLKRKFHSNSFITLFLFSAHIQRDLFPWVWIVTHVALLDVTQRTWNILRRYIIIGTLFLYSEQAMIIIYFLRFFFSHAHHCTDYKSVILSGGCRRFWLLNNSTSFDLGYNFYGEAWCVCVCIQLDK